MGVCWARRNRSEVRGKRARSTRFRRAFCAAALAIAALVPLESSVASETITYTYDARGRLVAVSHGSTGPNAGISASYSYDKGDNRTNVVVIGPSPVIVADWSFETPVQAAGGYVYAPVVMGATFSGGSGIAANNSAWGFAAAPDGNQVGFLQIAASISLSVSGLTPGSSYNVNFWSAQRAGQLNPVSVSIGGVALGTYTPASASFAPVSTPAFVASAAGETLTFTTSGGPADVSSAIDAVTVTPASSALPPCAGVSFAVANTSTTEGGNAGFTMTKTGSTASSCSVSYATANGTAAAGSDYTAASGTLTFSSTQTSQTVAVATIDDTTVESAETFTLSLSSPTGGATLGTPATATATINDNDTLPCTGVSFNVAGTAANEGSPLVFTVGKTGSTSSSCSVNYATSDDTAVAGTDYIAKSGTLTFSSTQTSQTVSVSTIDNDRLVDRYMYLNLSSPTSGATLSNSQASGTIIHSGGTGGCTLRCQTPLQSPEAIDSTATTQPAPDPTDPPQPPGDR